MRGPSFISPSFKCVCIYHSLFMPVNPYAVSTTNFKTAVFPWDRLLDREPGIAGQILSRCSTCCEPYYETYNAYWPQRLRPEQFVANYLDMTAFLIIERRRANILGHGPRDTLTVTFSDVVTRGGPTGLDYYAAQAEEEGWPFDEDAICRAMDYTQTWTDVKKIRLLDRTAIGSYWLSTGRRDFCVELVRQSAHGEETVRLPRLLHFGLALGMTAFDNFARDLTERLHLRRAFVGGADEYAV
jgi:hypothetical protein